MLYSCTHMATVGVKGLTCYKVYFITGTEKNTLFTLHEDDVMCLVSWVDVPQRVAELLMSAALSNGHLITDIVLNHRLTRLSVCYHFVLNVCTVCPICHSTIYTSAQHQCI